MEDLGLSDHSNSMRRAALYCIDALGKILHVKNTKDVCIDECVDHRTSASTWIQNRRKMREEKYQMFWDAPRAMSPCNDVISSAKAMDSNNAPRIQCHHWSEFSGSPVIFRRSFHDANLPCLLVLDGDKEEIGSGLVCKSYNFPTEARLSSDTNLAIKKTSPNPWYCRLSKAWQIDHPSIQPCRYQCCESQRKQDQKNSTCQDKESYLNNDFNRINRQWFVAALGEETIVPVRYHATPSLLSSRQASLRDHDGQSQRNDQDAALASVTEAYQLDEEGRATECETKHISIKAWVEMMEEQSRGEKGAKGSEKLLESTTKGLGRRNTSLSILSNHSTRDGSPYYLKDWHLQLELEKRSMTKVPNMNYTVSDEGRDDVPLYTCPPIFEYDLLNSFLLKFTKGDYRFCYWGPKGSYTPRHSDVLNSFSWSYNVIGTKRWTFFRKPCSHPCESESNEIIDKLNRDKESTVTIVQRAGQAIFVPSTWQHEVVNLEETISINHNWITTANLDLCWDCLLMEMADISKELVEWGIDSIAAEESMLRGCVGLDVTGFFLMTLVRLVDLLPQVITLHEQGQCVAKESSYETNEKEAFNNNGELNEDICRLSQMIRILIDDQNVRLVERIDEVLQSGALSSDLLCLTKEIVWPNIDD